MEFDPRRDTCHEPGSLWIANTIILAVIPTVVPLAAQEPAGSHTAELVSGTCASPGDVVAPLDDTGTPSGQPAGAAGSVATASAYTVVALCLEQLPAEPHAIRIGQSDGTVVACGEIGGAATPATGT